MDSGAAMEVFNPIDNPWRCAARRNLFKWVDTLRFGGLRNEIGWDPTDEALKDVSRRNRGISLSLSGVDVDIYDPYGDGACLFRYVKGSRTLKVLVYSMSLHS